ncbi:MAG: hypothetical protein LC747_00635 [Acidobacteria bacterium]|nr:hypothetical protein [Acidobacteriota bacterium]
MEAAVYDEVEIVEARLDVDVPAGLDRNDQFERVSHAPHLHAARRTALERTLIDDDVKTFSVLPRLRACERPVGGD